MNYMSMNPNSPCCFAIVEQMMPGKGKNQFIQGLVKRHVLTLSQLNDFSSHYPKGVSYIQPLPLQKQAGDKRLKNEVFSVVIEIT